MEFVGYYKCEKLIRTSGGGRRIKNKIVKQGSSKIHTNKVSPTFILGFGCSPYKYTSHILSDYLVSSIIKTYS